MFCRALSRWSSVGLENEEIRIPYKRFFCRVLSRWSSVGLQHRGSGYLSTNPITSPCGWDSRTVPKASCASRTDKNNKLFVSPRRETPVCCAANDHVERCLTTVAADLRFPPAQNLWYFAFLWIRMHVNSLLLREPGAPENGKLRGTAYVGTP